MLTNAAAEDAGGEDARAAKDATRSTMTRGRAQTGTGPRTGLGTACAEGVQVVSAQELVEHNDAVVLACGATLPRELEVPGRGLRGVHLALEYLKPSNLVREGRLAESPISAAGKRVVIIGGGDTGADCLGTAHRQGATEVIQLEILPAPARRPSR